MRHSLFLRVTYGLAVTLAIWLAGSNTSAASYAVAVALSLGALPSGGNAAAAQQVIPDTRRKDLGELSQGTPSGFKIGGGETHIFHTVLRRGQYLRVIVEQEGIDLSISIFEPGSKASLIAMDSPNGSRGSESVSVVARADGDYRVEVRSDTNGAMPAGYKLSSEGPREPAPDDLKRIEAERNFLEGRRLVRSSDAESRKKALEKYKAALESWLALGDKQRAADMLYSIAVFYRAQSDVKAALDYFGQALAVWEAEGNLYGQAFVQNEIGATVRDRQNPQDALPFYEKAKQLYARAGDQWGVAWLENNTGLAYARLGQHRQALEYYNRSLQTWRSVGDRDMEANTLNNVGGSLDRLGDPSQALTNYQQAMRLWQENGNRARLASAYNNVGSIRHGFGDLLGALDDYNRALALHRELKNDSGEALALDNAGLAYADWGEPQRALEYFNQSLVIRRRRQEPRGLGLTLDNLGYASMLLGDHQGALKYFEEAIPNRDRAKDSQGLASTLGHLGRLYGEMGDPRKALDYYDKALRIQKETENKLGQAITLSNRGHTLATMGEWVKAAETLTEALSLWNALRDPQGQAVTLYGMARAESGRGNRVAARNRVGEAISIIESLRASTANRQLRTDFLASKQDFYELDIEVKMRLHELDRAGKYQEAALESSERRRARELRDMLAEGQSDIRRFINPELLSRKVTLEGRLNSISGRLLLLRGTRTRPEDAAATANEVNALTGEFDALYAQYEDLQAQIRKESPRYAQLMQPRPTNTADVEALIDGDTLLLEYALGERHSYIWVVDRSGVNSYTLAGRAEIENAARKLRETLTAFEASRPGEGNLEYRARLERASADYPQEAATLSRLILAPIARGLGKKRLVIVADGALQFIPFEALPTAAGGPDAPRLALDHEIVYLPSASTLPLLRVPRSDRPTKSVAVFADPVFSINDERIPASARRASPSAPTSQAGVLSSVLRDFSPDNVELRLDRLRYSLNESDEIMSLLPRGSGMKAVGFGANREAATSPAVAGYRVVHFATHALLDDKRPQLSGLVLSLLNERGEPQDGFIRLYDVYNLNLTADLVVLSACRTGIGKTVKGEGLIGLTRGFMYAGTSRVVASLWKVDDEATAALMKSFYRHLLREHLSAAAALRLAKLDLMRAREQWQAPYYWAGFILQGDWR